MTDHYVRGEYTWRAGEQEPYLCDVYFPDPPGHRVEDYPPRLHRDVAKANRGSDLNAMRPIWLKRADPKHLFDLMDQIHEGEISLGIYRVSEGYTKTATYNDEGGYVLA